MRVDTGVITSYHINVPFGTLGVVHDAQSVLYYGGATDGTKLYLHSSHATSAPRARRWKSGRATF
jgi:hypothetical protein